MQLVQSAGGDHQTTTAEGEDALSLSKSLTSHAAKVDVTSIQ